MFAKTFVLAGLAAIASAHQTIKYPASFAGTISSPLDASGSNFPCQALSSSFYAASAVDTWALGSSQTISTLGSAVHGGGSAQFSITYDKNPTQASTWKVIHTVQGGFPARGLNDNRFPSDPNLANPDTYDFTVPTTIPAGDVIFSVSWINRLGNREFYQFCAPITLTGTGGTLANYNALPDMVVLNIMGKASVTDANDVEFADPGSSVEDNLGVYGFATELCCAAGCGDSVCTRNEGGDGGSAPVPTPTTGPAPTTSVPGGVFITTPPQATETAAPPATTEAPIPTPVQPEPVPTSSAPAAPVPTSGSGTGGRGALTGACSPEGQWNCVDGSSFQQCGSGLWSPVMALAAGTSCEVGESSALTISAVSGKRAVRAFRA